MNEENAKVDYDQTGAVTREQIDEFIEKMPVPVVEEPPADTKEATIVETNGDNQERTPIPPPPLVLTPEQQQAVDLITDFVSDSDLEEYKLGGYAGTGKTTVIKTVKAELSKNYGVVVSAFTGKAVNVLERKGITAQTLHSLMYHAEQDPKTGAVEFFKRSCLEADPEIIIVDESSMISSDLYRDLKSFGKKLLFVGDPGQLEPVGDNPNLMARPDFILSKIHRQAEKSPIISLANFIRNGGNMTHCDDPEGGLTVRPKQLKASEACSVDQVICAKNKTRTGMNDSIRAYKQRMTQMEQGEKIIVLRNNLNWGVFNGMILFVDEVVEEKYDYWRLNCKDELGRVYAKLPIWKQPFNEPLLRTKKDLIIPRKTELKGMQLVLADYGYVITCHKSQGSEWDHVMVFDEWMPPSVWDMKRWRYTAITRAAKKLTYLL